MSPRIRVLREEPGSLDCEAVIRPVAADLTAVTAFGRRLEQQAGDGALERLRAVAELPVGAAMVTPGGDLPAAFLIHVVIQSKEEPASEHTVGLALLNGLRRVDEWGVEGVAVPPLGTGAGALDAEASAALLVRTLREFEREGGSSPEVLVVVSSDYEEDVFRRAVGVRPMDREARGGSSSE